MSGSNGPSTLLLSIAVPQAAVCHLGIIKFPDVFDDTTEEAAVEVEAEEIEDESRRGILKLGSVTLSLFKIGVAAFDDVDGPGSAEEFDVDGVVG